MRQFHSDQEIVIHPVPFAFRCTPSTIMISPLSPTWHSFIECPTWPRPLPRCWNRGIDECTIGANEWAVYHRRGYGVTPVRTSEMCTSRLASSESSSIHNALFFSVHPIRFWTRRIPTCGSSPLVCRVYRLDRNCACSRCACFEGVRNPRATEF